jgi:predicted MFS family arabinose efflux permease
VPGAVTVTLGLLAVIFAVIERNLPVGVVGLALLVAFWAIERRAAQPLVPIRILRRPTIRWGNFSALTIFALEPAMIFLVTLYLQNVLGLSPLVTGLVFGVPGLAAVFAGPVAGRLIGRVGVRTVLFVGMVVQGVAIAPMVFVGPSPWSLVLVVVGLFVSFFGHVSAIVSSTVTATSGLPNSEQGLATGLSSMTQQVGITVGIPILAAVASTFGPGLGGIQFALGVVAVATVLGAVAVFRGLRPRSTTSAPAAATPALEPAA